MQIKCFSYPAFHRIILIPIHLVYLMTEFLQRKHQSLDNFFVIRLENEAKVGRSNVGACKEKRIPRNIGDDG